MKKIKTVPETKKNLIIDLINTEDSRAFKTLYQMYWDRMLQFASRYLKDRDSCKEIVQELFIQLHANKVPPTLKCSFTTYLYSALRNRIFNHIRNRSVYIKHVNSAASMMPNSQNTVEHNLRLKELQTAVAQELARLPERYREAYLLRQTDQYTVKTIACKLNRPVDTVEKQIRRVHGILKERLMIYRSVG